MANEIITIENLKEFKAKMMEAVKNATIKRTLIDSNDKTGTDSKGNSYTERSRYYIEGNNLDVYLYYSFTAIGNNITKAFQLNYEKLLGRTILEDALGKISNSQTSGYDFMIRFCGTCVSLDSYGIVNEILPAAVRVYAYTTTSGLKLNFAPTAKNLTDSTAYILSAHLTIPLANS